MAYNAYLKLDGVKGEEADGSILLKSFDLKVASETTAGRAAPPVTYYFNVKKSTDSSSPGLYQLAAGSQVFTTGSLTVSSGTPPVAMATFTLTNGYISQTSGEGNVYGDDAPTESITLSFQKITLT